MAAALLVSALLPAAAPPAACRCRPSEPCWPAASAWAALNASVSGRLLVPADPVPAACGAGLETAACARQLALSVDPFALILEPAGFEKVGYEGAFNSTPPAFAVAAESAHDVAAGVKFAAARNLRMTVKNTGHDYIGRSTAPDSLMIWTHKLGGVTFEKGFRPASCPATTPAADVVHFGAGVIWFDLYKQVIARRLMMAGGTCTTVGAGGGYWMGGGHSDRVKQLGTAASNVVAVEAVLADGRIVTASECENSDIFWALRGGGGGTFAVVTRVTMRTYPLPKNWGGCGGYEFAASVEAFPPMLAAVFRTINATQAEFGWGAGMSVTMGGRGNGTYFAVGLGPSTAGDHDAAAAEAALQPMVNFAAANKGKGIVQVGKGGCAMVPSEEWWDPKRNPSAWHQSIIPGKYEHAGLGEASSFIFGEADHYISAAEFASPEERLVPTVMQAVSTGYPVMFQFEKGIAGAPPEVLARQRKTSMHPEAINAAALITMNSFQVILPPAPAVSNEGKRAKNGEKQGGNGRDTV